MLNRHLWAVILRYGLLAAIGSVTISAMPYALGNSEWFTASTVNLTLTLTKLGWTIVCAVLATRRIALINEGTVPFHHALGIAWFILMLMGTADILHYYVRMNYWHPEQFEWVRDLQLQAMEKKWMSEGLSEPELTQHRLEFLSQFKRPTFGIAVYQWALWLIISFGVALVVGAFTKKQR